MVRFQELVGDGVDQHARHHADEAEYGGELEQQLAAEAPTPHAQHEADERAEDDQSQQAGDAEIDPEEPDVVPVKSLVAATAARQQEGHDPRHAGGQTSATTQARRVLRVTAL